ncbi:MAG: DUF4215 domain-containing protein [Myxococcota bacterium]
MMNLIPGKGRIWTAATVLVSALMLFAAACGGGEEEPPQCTFGVAEDGKCVNADRCLFQSDCLPGYSCSQGTCNPDQECTADADCDAGVCGSNGVCVNPDTCTSNDECVSKTYCSDAGTCEADPCSAITCVRGTCEAGSGECTSKDTCTESNELFDCVQGERCLEETCLAEDDFCEQLDCQRGVCSFADGQCVGADDCGGDDTQCLEGQFCNEDDECAADLCVTNNVTCEEGVCMPKTGECQNAETCSSNDDCLGDHWCIEGTCELQSMACGDADGEGGCFGNQSCVYDSSSQTASCEAPDVCTTSLDCLDGTQCGGESCLPTVACEDDIFEPNDNESDATVFTDVDSMQLVEASLCSSDTDVYTFNVGDLEPTAVRGLLSIDLNYAARDIGLGEIQVELFEEQSDDSYTSVATESSGARGQDGGVELTHEIGPSTVGGFRVEVSGLDGMSDAGISYELGVDIIDDLVVDACDGARVIQDGDILTADMRQATSSLLRQSCATGEASSERAEQVFVFDVDQASRVDLTIVPEGDSDDPVVSLRQSCATSGTEVACSDSGGETESLEAELLEPGTYYAVVSASPEGTLNRYDISLSMTDATCAPSSSYCEDANAAQICFGGAGFTSVDCSNGCEPTTGRCFPIQGDVCETTTEITAATTETIFWGELRNDYDPSTCVPAAEGSTDASGPDRAFQVTIPDQQAVRATLDVGDNDAASLYLLEDCQNTEGACLAGVNETAGGDETLIWSNRTGADVTAFLIADSSDEALLAESTLDIEFVDLVCDPEGSDALICDPSGASQVLECGEFGLEYDTGEDCGNWPCAAGECLRPNTCAGALDITADAASGGATVNGDYDNFSDDYSGDGCGVTSSGSDGGEAVFEVTLQDGEVLTATATVNSGLAYPSMYLMPTCGSVDGTCLAGDGASSDPATLDYANNTGAAETLFLFVDNDGYSGDFTLEAEIVTPVCGNDVVEPSEECDDGNTVSGDGCSDICEIETDVCGNSVVEPTNNETCDDGNTTAGDGCSDVCALEGTPLELSSDTGATIAVAGELTSSDDTFSRPYASCGSNSSTGYYYDAYEFTNNTGGDVTITATASWSFDGYMHVYSSPFDPTDPTATCLDGDDDFNGTSGSQVENITVADGDTVVVVGTSFSTGTTGDYSIEVEVQ